MGPDIALRSPLISRRQRMSAPGDKPRLSSSLALEVLNTRSCSDMLPQIEAFEDSVFGPNFEVPAEKARAWAQSGSWFCSAVAGQAVVGRRQIFSMLSILVTTTRSRDALFAGTIDETELEVWRGSSRYEKPALYLATVIGAASDHLAVLYDSVGRELESFRDSRRTQFTSGFSIASGPAGFSHMGRNGFRSVEGNSYLGQYPLMIVDQTSAVTPFWKNLLMKAPSATRSTRKHDSSSFSLQSISRARRAHDVTPCGAC